METDQPYSPPRSDVGGPPGPYDAENADAITPGMVDALRKTRPWVLFMGVILMLTVGLMVVGGIIGVIAGLAGVGSEVGPLGAVGFGVLYLVLAVIYFVPGLYLLRFAGAAKQVATGNRPAAIEAALGHQLAFWRVVGIIAISILGIYALIMVAVIAAGLFASVG